jgi:hypothetical protein
VTVANPRDLAHVRACLDDPFTPHLLALADWHEEAGQDALARAYRRIARERKVPDIYADGWKWRRGLAIHRYSIAAHTQAKAEHSLRKEGVADLTKATLSQAYHALALAYAEEEGP